MAERKLLARKSSVLKALDSVIWALAGQIGALPNIYFLGTWRAFARKNGKYKQKAQCAKNGANRSLERCFRGAELCARG
jgi:hypothetical protein